MLVLSRIIGERIMIGDDVIVQVIDVRGGRVRLGITAPRDVKVWREEVAERRGGKGDGRENSRNTGG